MLETYMFRKTNISILLTKWEKDLSDNDLWLRFCDVFVKYSHISGSWEATAWLFYDETHSRPFIMEIQLIG